MTLAVCVQCGTEKIGAFNLCTSCGFEPQTPQDQAKSLMLSDHNMTADELKSVSQEIQRGVQIDFDEAAIQELSQEIEILNVEAPEVERSMRNCVFGVFAVIIGIIILIFLIFP